MLSSRSFDDGIDRWQSIDTRPAAALADYVESYGWWREHTTSFTARRELAGTKGVFIVNLGAPLEIRDAAGAAHRFEAGDGFAGGMAEATSVSRSTGAMEGIHVRMPIGRLALLTGVPLAALANRVIPLRDLGRGARQLGARLAEEHTLMDRISLLDSWCLGQLAAARPGDAAIAHALALFDRSASVEQCAADLGWSRKRLAQRFRDATGLLPRSYIRLARFERFAGLLDTMPHDSLAAIAAEAGYADQSHLSHDVVRLAGLAPGALRALLIPEGGGIRAA